MILLLLVFSSPDPKAQVSFSDCMLHVVRPRSICLFVNFLHFHLLLENHWVNFNKLGASICGWRGFKFIQMKSQTSLTRRDNNKIGKIHWLVTSKSLLLQNLWTNFNQTWHILQCCVKGINSSFLHIKYHSVLKKEIITFVSLNLCYGINNSLA